MKYTLPAITAALMLAAVAQAQPVTMKLVSQDAAKRTRGTRPQSLKLTTEVPEDKVLKIPGDIRLPRFGVLTLGPADEQETYVVLIDEKDGKPVRVFVDSQGDNDLTNDTPATWTALPYQGNDGKAYAIYRSSMTVMKRYGTETVSLRLNLEYFDRNDPGRALSRDTLLYYPDYAREGELKLGEKTYKAMLTETTAQGDFRGRMGAPVTGVMLLIDRNENGLIDVRGEFYDTGRPFNIGGVTYEIAEMAPSGSSFVVRRSARSVPEIPAPPDLRPGKKAVPFTKQTLTGTMVRFPDDYKGKLVLLTFWSSWCGDCQEEFPYLTGAYAAYHDKGLEILGVSLDQPNTDLAAYLKANKLVWPQIYDGKFWQAEQAQSYLITAIPTSFLVDGDTGEILATGDDLLNKRLDGTLAKALAKKFPSAF